MKIQEADAKSLLVAQGLPVPEWELVRTAKDARAAAERMLPAGSGRVVIKAQVLVGGRGKAGGVKVVDGPDAAAEAAEAILGLDIKGHITRRLWVEQAIAIAKEYYVSITFDRAAKQPLHRADSDLIRRLAFIRHAPRDNRRMIDIAPDHFVQRALGKHVVVEANYIGSRGSDSRARCRRAASR